MEDDCIEELRVGIKQLLPKDDTAGSLLLIISIYVTLLSIIEQTSMKEALKDADDQMIFNINEEITNVTVAEISSSILWNCRDYSVTKNNYKGIYITMLVLVILWIVIGMFKCPNTDVCKRSLLGLQVISNILLRISLIFLLTSYDTDLFACLCGPRSIEYMVDTHAVYLELPRSVLKYQISGPVVAIVFGLFGWVVGKLVSEKDNEDKEREKKKREEEEEERKRKENQEREEEERKRKENQEREQESNL